MNKKTIALTTLFIAISIGVANKSMHAYRRHHYGRHHGRHRGHVSFGVGVGRHGRHRGGHVSVGIGVDHRRRDRHYYSRPWWRRWWGYPTDSIPRYNWEDTRGKMYWKIRNKSNVVITATSDKQQIAIKPGQTHRLYRDESFVFEAKHNSGPLREFETDNHYVTLYTGRDIFRPWKSRIKMRSVVDWGGY